MNTLSLFGTGVIYTFGRVLALLLLSTTIPFLVDLLSPEPVLIAKVTTDTQTAMKLASPFCGYFHYNLMQQTDSQQHPSVGGSSLSTALIAQAQLFFYTCATHPPIYDCGGDSSSSCPSSIPLPYGSPLPHSLLAAFPQPKPLLSFLLTSPLYLLPSSTSPPTTPPNKLTFFTRQLATSSLYQKLFVLSQYPFPNPLTLLAATLTSTFLGAVGAFEFYRAMPVSDTKGEAREVEERTGGRARSGR